VQRSHAYVGQVGNLRRIGNPPAAVCAMASRPVAASRRASAAGWRARDYSERTPASWAFGDRCPGQHAPARREGFHRLGAMLRIDAARFPNAAVIFRFRAIAAQNATRRESAKQRRFSASVPLADRATSLSFAQRNVDRFRIDIGFRDSYSSLSL
jgi:hypothetical protein